MVDGKFASEPPGIERLGQLLEERPRRLAACAVGMDQRLRQ